MARDTEGRLADSLWKMSPEEYGADYNQHLLEMYKLFVTVTDSHNTRRQAANNFSLTVNTALLALVGAVVGDRSRFSFIHPGLVALLAIAGIGLCVGWYLLVRTYRNLTKVRFEVTHALEDRLPSAPWTTEWMLMGYGKDRQHPPISSIEMVIPVIFICIYLILMASVLNVHWW